MSHSTQVTEKITGWQLIQSVSSPQASSSQTHKIAQPRTLYIFKFFNEVNAHENMTQGPCDLLYVVQM